MYNYLIKLNYFLTMVCPQSIRYSVTQKIDWFDIRWPGKLTGSIFGLDLKTLEIVFLKECIQWNCNLDAFKINPVDLWSFCNLTYSQQTTVKQTGLHKI